MNNILSKREFCDLIRDLEKISDYENKIMNEEKRLLSSLKNRLLLNSDPSYSFQEPIIIGLLKKMFNDINDISYFIYELDYGKAYKEGCVVQNINGVEVNVDMSTPEKLYDLLISQMNNKENCPHPEYSIYIHQYIDTAHMNSIWYNGPIATINFKDKEYILCAKGSVSATLILGNNEIKLKNSDDQSFYDVAKHLIKNDSELKGTNIVFNDTNWFEVFVSNFDDVLIKDSFILSSDNITSAISEVLRKLGGFEEQEDENESKRYKNM